MCADLDKITILPKMRYAEEPNRIFKLIWTLDLDTDYSKCLVKLLFRNVKSGFYLVDTVPPELLSFCTVGSFFAKGKKIRRPAEGVVRRFKILSTENNHIAETWTVLSDAEYDLSLSNSNYTGNYINELSHFCKRQLCLAFYDGDTKIVIPCSVLGGVYYFRSTSLREAVFAMRLRGLFEDYSIDRASRHAKITMKPGAADSDAKSIVRFLTDGFAEKRMNLIRNHLNATKGLFKRLKTDFPVMQELTIKVRGHLTSDNQGGRTFVVFQILEENSEFPFSSLEIARRQIHYADWDTGSFPAFTSSSGEEMIKSHPSARYIRRILENHVSIANANSSNIRETKIYLPPHKDDEAKPPIFMPGEQFVLLSSQQEFPGIDDSIAKSEVVREDGGETCQEKTLEDFEQLVRPVDDCKWITKKNVCINITEFILSRQPVWRKERLPGKLLSLKESYDRTDLKRRESAYAWFVYRDKRVCMVEIDQHGLPGGCSTYILISRGNMVKCVADDVVQAYVEGRLFSTTRKLLRTKGVVLANKHHPSGKDEEHQKSWRSRVLEIVEKS